MENIDKEIEEITNFVNEQNNENVIYVYIDDKYTFTILKYKGQNYKMTQMLLAEDREKENDLIRLNASYLGQRTLKFFTKFGVEAIKDVNNKIYDYDDIPDFPVVYLDK